MSNLDAPVNNTPYNQKELDHFKDLLLEEREEAVATVQEIQASIEDQRSLDNERASAQDHHPGDIATEEEEKETDYLLRERSRKKVDQIDAALRRIENKTYGVCEDTGKKIQKERLEAIPYTRFSVDARKKDDSEHPGPQV